MLTKKINSLKIFPQDQSRSFSGDEPGKSLEEPRGSPEFAFGCLQALVSKLVERGELSRY